jgi:hypothetical protein
MGMSEAPMAEPRKIGKTAPRVRLLDAMILVAAIAFVLAESRGPEWMAMLWLWGIHLGIGAVLSAPVVVWGIGRVHWSLLDLLAFLLPFALWFALSQHFPAGKSLANLAEPLYFSFAIPVAALARVVVGARVPERACSVALVVLLCFVASGVYVWTPALPE